MSSKRNNTERLIRQYQSDIASLEEKEEYLTRRIQVMENLIPTIVVWYMWKNAQSGKPGTFSQTHSEEEAKKQLLHLENILEELQDADYILKEEEKVLRSRIEELESSIRDDTDEAFPRQKEITPNEATKERKRIKALEQNKIQFKDLLEDPNTDWPMKCKELCEKVNELTETFKETNDALKDKDEYIKQLQQNLGGKGFVVEERIKDLEKQNQALLSEVIDKEKVRDAEEAKMNKRVFSAVQEAMEEVETIRKSLTKKKAPRGEEKEQKGIAFYPLHHSITEEVEEETKADLLDTESPDSLPDFYQKPLVLTPDEVLPGSRTTAAPPKPTATVHPLPQIFESLETVQESSPRADSKVKLRSTATGTIVSVPPDIPEVPSVRPEDLTSRRRASLPGAEPVAQDFQMPQLQQQPVLSDSVARQPVLGGPTTTISKDMVQQKKLPSETDVSGTKNLVPAARVSKSPSVSTMPKPQAVVSPVPRSGSVKSLGEPGLSSAEAEVLVPLPGQPSEAPLPLPGQLSEASLVPEVKPGIPEALKDQPAERIKVQSSRQDLADESVGKSQSSKPARSSKVSEISPGVPPPELNTIFVKQAEPQSSPEKPKLKSVRTSEPIPLTSKAAADMSEAQAMMTEPNEVPYSDGVQPTSFGLALQQEVGVLEPSSSADGQTGQTLQGKCRVKDHLIKNMADQLRDLAKKNVWSGNKLLKDISSDPVKTYDFDRTTLYKYIKGEEPRDLAPSLKSNDPYSSSNPLKVKLGQKLDKDSLLVEWGPPPSPEVVGFQIFINGEFKYWVHSAKRSKALLHPVDLATRMEITVSPINADGDIVHRSSVTYNP